MVLINGRWYPKKHPERDTLSSGKRGYAKKLAERRALLAQGIDPDTLKIVRINPKKACRERGDRL